jgi:hypothetical protein
MEVCGELPIPSALLLGNESRFLFHLELGGFGSRNGCSDEEKNSFPLWESIPARPVYG